MHSLSKVLPAGAQVTRTKGWSELRVRSTPQLSISISPTLTALAMAADALAGRRRGLPEPWRRAIGSRVGRIGHEAVRPLGAPGHPVAPDFLVPRTPADGDVTVQAQITALRDFPPENLVKDLERTFGPGEPPAHWRSAAARPAHWLRGYAGALSEVWNTTEPLWKQARSLLDREVQRVGIATVRGGAELLLGALSERITYGERGLLISGTEAGTYDLGARDIVLVPMLAGRESVIFSLDDPEAVWIAYPVPGVEALWREPMAPAVDELSALVGPVRADLLCALDQPMTMSMLATGMRIAPSGLTYHCDRLRAGRLITRERRGREVWIARTERAEELLDLFRR
ncbi:ArsR/SmtB family transcription factor [Nonomuraea jiangxiensis]|uniref:Helix-turn-helix domain-containing protein n=1 Tax=Nonomuraea jiangxiensis TaxID=633440 RepID=A0A1G7ZDL0_9ACTN|nr:winged helix-turn-helix domain-containing protein [Nonomuraea jiangxiensis]SDH06657.1 Helix-turn-helix domain-containing protein [Nonomuraea jiangxiensis]